MLGGCLQKWVKFEGVSEIVPKFNLDRSLLFFLTAPKQDRSCWG
jgi:hypothetical protein